MKSVFRFPLDLGRAELVTEQSIRFATTGTITVKEADEIITEDVRDFPIEVRVVPKGAGGDGIRNSQDWLELHLAGRPERYQPFIQQFASEVAEKLAFFYPGLHIEGGFSEAERIPENENEVAEVGEERHLVSISIREVDPNIPFSRDHLSLVPHMAGLERIIRQFNSARQATSAIDQYIGMYKIIETLFYHGRGHAILVLKESSELRDILRNAYTVRQSDDEPWTSPDDESIDSMIVDIVKMRDQCAHLREHNAFGYAPGDTAVFREVEPMVGIISSAAREAIRRRIDEKSGGRLPNLPPP